MLILSEPSCTACSVNKGTEVAKPDFVFQDHGSVGVLTPMTDAARAWIESNVEVAQTWAKGIAIEARYVGPVLAGLADAGLEVS